MDDSLRPRLRRRAHDRVVGGVAGGLADRYGWPVGLLRAGFGAGAFVWAVAAYRALVDASFDLGLNGDAVVFLARLFALAPVVYLALWILVPREDVNASPLGRAAHAAARPIPTLRSWLGIALLVAGAAVLADQLGIWQPNVALAIALIAVGIALYRRDEARTDEPHSASALEGERRTDAGIDAPGSAPTVPIPAVRREPRERSPLGWLVLGVAALAVGVTAIANDLGDLDLELAVYPAIALAVLGAGLLVGTIVGRARWLIAPALLLVPFTLLSSVVHVPLSGGFGDVFVSPQLGEGSPAVHRRVLGQIYLDYSALAGSDEQVRLEATTGLGQITVMVPFDAHVVVTGRTGMGLVGVGREFTNRGLDRSLERRWEPRRGDGPTITLDLEVGIGDVSVVRMPPTRQQVRELEREEASSP